MRKNFQFQTVYQDWLGFSYDMKFKSDEFLSYKRHHNWLRLIKTFRLLWKDIYDGGDGVENVRRNSFSSKETFR